MKGGDGWMDDGGKKLELDNFLPQNKALVNVG